MSSPFTVVSSGNTPFVVESRSGAPFAVQLSGADLLGPIAARADAAAFRAEVAAASIEASDQRQYSNVPAPGVLLHFYGQSLSVGLGTSGLLSGASAFANAMMPDSGVQDATWTNNSEGLTGTASLATALVPLNAATNAHDLEAPVIGAANQLASRMRYAAVIAANAGRGGYGVGGLQKGYNSGNGPYTLLLDQYETYAGLFGKPIRPVLCWMQGEADASVAGTSKAGYTSAVQAIINDYVADSGQPVHFFTYQLSSHTIRSPGYNYNVALALAEMGEASDDVSVVTPMYPFDYTDGVHLTSASSRLCGAYFGKAIDHYLHIGEKFRPLTPISIERVGKVITVEFFVPAGNLVYDDSLISDPGNMGFEVFLQSGGSALSIADSYVYGNRAVIELASVPGGPVDVLYALGTTLNGQSAGRSTGARGCLRDEDATPAYFDTNTKLRNWCVMFRKPEGWAA